MTGMEERWKRRSKLGICLLPVTQLWAKAEAAEAADELLCGWLYEVLEEKSGFLRIRTHYAYEGWMDAAEYVPVPRAYGERRELHTVGVHAADVLYEPRVQGRRLTTLFAGSLVRAAGESRLQGGGTRKEGMRGGRMQNGRTWEDWIRVTLPDGREGYTRAHFLTPRKDGDGFLREGRLEALAGAWGGLEKEREALLRQEIVDRALSFLGTQYRWGGKTVLGIDCSGLAFMSYMLCGILIYRDARIMPGFPVKEIPAERAGKGDLLFFPGHVAVSLGEGRFVHATAYPGCSWVTINSLHEKDPDYRADLRERLIAAGSIFPQ